MDVSMPITHQTTSSEEVPRMTTMIHQVSPEAAVPPMVFSHALTDGQVTRATTGERARPVHFRAPAERLRR